MSSEDELFVDAAERGAAYLRGIRDRRVAPDESAVAALAGLRCGFPGSGTDPASVLKLLDAVGSPATVANSGGRYFGFVNGGALPAARAANVLAAAWDQNASLGVMSPVAAALEDVALAWLREALALPAETGGGFVSGATVANLTCLAAARHALLARCGWDVESHGLFGAPPLTVIVGAEAHASLLKALAILGLGRDRVITVPVDDQGRIRAEALPPVDPRTLICLQAGNVNSGAFDPFEEVCAIARAAGAWVHVDGAFGLWAAASPARAALVTGLSGADSWAADAHKWLNVPYDCGLAFVREAGALRRAMSVDAAYLPAGTGRDPMHWTPEASRRARGVEVWAALLSLGRSGLAELVERTCRHARRFADALRERGCDILNEVVLNQVVVSFGSDDETRRVIEAVQQDGTCWCGGTRWHGRGAMRISVSSWATTDDDVTASIKAILAAAGR